MQRPIAKLIAVAVVGLLGALASVSASAAEPFGRLSVDEVAAKLGKPGVYVFDNNSKDVYANGHVPSAKWLDYDKVTASDLPKDKAATLIFYCANES